MKTLFIEDRIKYTGEQLKSLFAYLNYKVQGDSIVAWQGACDIPFVHMVDGEDVLDHAKISGESMLHFIVEIFHQNIFTAVSFQRLISAIVKDLFVEYLEKNNFDSSVVYRKGDDIYFDGKKFSISIASSARFSSLIHFAVNITNAGTPVSTCALEDFKIPVREFADKILDRASTEWQDIAQATTKVKAL